MDNLKKVHFMGIGGSGISAVAVMAKKKGIDVTGCDLNTNTPYSDNLRREIKDIYKGHNSNHLKGVDLLVTTPAVIFQNNKHPEIIESKKRGILITWEKFLGKYLQIGKKVICVAGTHGKSTITAMVGILLEKSGYDPSVVIGATVKECKANYRIGKGKYFVTEADEFYDNFLNYSPNYLILNNIEFDHPDYFSSFDDVIKSFIRFLKNLREEKILFVNQDSEGVKELLSRIDKKYLKTIYIVGYTLKKSPLIKLGDSFYGEIVKKENNITYFNVTNKERRFKYGFSISIPGEYNVLNSIGVIALGNILKIGNSEIKEGISNYKGIGRRFELLGEKKGIKVYDDYAHHPTAIKATLSALRQMYPENEITVVVEPHSYSRTKALLKDYNGIFESIDKVVIGPIFKARDSQDFGVSGQAIVEACNHHRAIYLESMEKIIKLMKTEEKQGSIIFVMGAGDSYRWAREILKEL